MTTKIIDFKMIKGMECLTVIQSPSKFRKFFGARPKTKQFINSGRQYIVSGLWVWYEYPSMVAYGDYEELDQYVRQLKYCTE